MRQPLLGRVRNQTSASRVLPSQFRKRTFQWLFYRQLAIFRQDLDLGLMNMRMRPLSVLVREVEASLVIY